MSAKKGLKGFLVFDDFGEDRRYGRCICNVLCIVVAESFENAAQTLGGKLGEIEVEFKKEKVIVFPKSLFKLARKEEQIDPGRPLEYRRGNLYLCIRQDEEKKVLLIKEFPWLEQEFIEPLNNKPE